MDKDKEACFDKALQIIRMKLQLHKDLCNEVGVILRNYSNQPYEIKTGDKIAQIIYYYTPSVKLEVTDVLSETTRNNKGFGSTDKESTKLLYNNLNSHILHLN